MKNEFRARVAREAARLLYYSLAEDYKSAKEAASQDLNLNVLPGNREVALALDELAEKTEGYSKGELLGNMRRCALEVMGELLAFRPKLVGSVWRGTSRRGSDIDITVYSEEPKFVVSKLKKSYSNVKTEYTSKTSDGYTNRYYHIRFHVPQGYEVEIVVRDPEAMDKPQRCEVYGDIVVGLTKNQLQELLGKDALKKFLPESKIEQK